MKQQQNMKHASDGSRIRLRKRWYLIALSLLGNIAVMGQQWPALGFHPSSKEFDAPLWGLTISMEFQNNFTGVYQNFGDPGKQTYTEGGFTISARNDKGRYSEWFDKSNVCIENGKLKLWGDYTDCPASICGSNIKTYAGAEVIGGTGFSDATGNTHYGFYEAKMKLPKGGGFAAWWLSQKNAGASYNQHPPEIDMMESIHPTFTNGTNRRILLTGQPYHYDAHDNSGATFGGFYHDELLPLSSTFAADYAQIDQFFNEYHVYGFLWTPDIMQLYMDGQAYRAPLSLSGNGLSIQVLLRLAFSFQIHAGDVTDEAGLMDPFLIEHFRYYEPTTPPTVPRRWGIAWNNEDIQENTPNVTFAANIPYQATADDLYVAGDFDATTPQDELVWLNKSAANVLMIMKHADGVLSWERNYWAEIAPNCMACGGIIMTSTTQVYAGNFSSSHSGDELMLVVPRTSTNTVHLLRFDGSAWVLLSTTTMGNANSQFHRFNYDGVGADELIVVGSMGDLSVRNFNGSSWSVVWSNLATPGSVPAATAPHFWTLNRTDVCSVGDFTGDAKDEIMFVSASGYAKLFNFSGTTWTQLWGAGTPGTQGYNGIGGFYPNPGDKYVVGDWDDDGKAEIFAISPTGQYAKILNFASSTWSTSWGNNGSGTVDAWWLKGADKATAGNFSMDPLCNANSQLLLIRGQLLSGNHKWRGNMYFSPLSQFWANAMHNEPNMVAIGDPDITDGMPDSYSLFPNPSDGKFQITGPAIQRVSVVDLSGRLILESTGRAVDLVDQPAGIYFIEVFGNRNRHQVLKAVKR